MSGGIHTAVRARNVLIVEDDLHVATVLEEMLLDIGFETVRQAPTVQSALALIEDQAPDAAIVDTNLFGTPAYRVAEALRSRGIPFIVVTGFDASRLPNAFMTTAVLRKPVSRDKLATALGLAISEARRG